MEHDRNWYQNESPEERVHARKNRITIITLLIIALAIFAVVFSIFKSNLPQEQSPTASSSAAMAITAVPAAESESSVTTVDPTAGLLVSFLDVGQGDSIFLRSPSGKTMLVDGGPEGSFTTIDRYLTAQGVVGLDVVVASHLHADHIGGLIQVVDTYPIAAFYYPPFDADSETYFQLLDALKESNAKVLSPLAGKNTLIPWDDAVEVRILAPYDTVYSDFNDTSYIIRVSYGNTAVLLTGDSTDLGEKLALKAQPNHYFKANVLKVAHHGSDDSTFEKFLETVDPSIAVISVGTGNDYGLPNQALLDRLAAHGITVYRTDEDGTITLLLDGTNVKVIE